MSDDCYDHTIRLLREFRKEMREMREDLNSRLDCIIRIGSSLTESHAAHGRGSIAALQQRVRQDGFKHLQDEKAFLDDLSGNI